TSRDGTVYTVIRWLQKGAEVNAVDNLGVTPLNAAANVNNTGVAKLLIEKGSNVNATTSAGIGGTAWAGRARSANLELTRLLLAHHADLNAISAENDGNVKNG